MSQFYKDGLDWTAGGYFTPPTPLADGRRAADPLGHQWKRLEEAVEGLKVGDFSQAWALLELLPYDNGVLHAKCCAVLGDSAPRSCIERMLEDLEEIADPERSIDYLRTLYEWANLSAVPVIWREYNRYYMYDSFEVVAYWLSDLLEAEPGELAEPPDEQRWADYEAALFARYDALRSRFQTDDVLVLYGEPLGARRIAQRLLGDLSGSHNRAFHWESRRRFEASTGIDCTSFFNEGRFQPLHAAVILERFLDSPDAARYEDNTRFFFGRKIPER